MGDLDLDNQVRRGAFDEGGDRLVSFSASLEIPRCPLTNVGTVRLHPGAGRLTLPAKSEAAELLRRTGEGTSGGIHDVVEYPGQIFMGVRAQGDEPPDRIEADPRK